VTTPGYSIILDLGFYSSTFSSSSDQGLPPCIFSWKYIPTLSSSYMYRWNWETGYPMPSRFARWSFSVTGVSMWKSLLANMHDPDESQDIFRQHLDIFACIVRLSAVHKTFYDNILYKFTSTLMLTSGLKQR